MINSINFPLVISKIKSPIYRHSPQPGILEYKGSLNLILDLVHTIKCVRSRKRDDCVITLSSRGRSCVRG